MKTMVACAGGLKSGSTNKASNHLMIWRQPMHDEKLKGLELLRKPFAANLINKLPKPTKRQTDEVKADYKKGVRCAICGTWHHPDVVHLDYVGHAALTDRLLEVDIGWTWEPMAVGNDGYPVIDANGGMWIRLTVCGVTRLGYGDAQGKVGGDAMKERIGDALRNASMRFGAALDLWHKGGDLHADDDDDGNAASRPAKTPPKPAGMAQSAIADYITTINDAVTLDELKARFDAAFEAAKAANDKASADKFIAAKDARKIILTTKEKP
jgi:hypothetical protein